MNRIIAIEGICCSGKSTLVSKLGNSGLATVKEYGEYIDGQFPRIAHGLEGLVGNTKFFIELERRRYQDGLIAISDHQTLIIDRSFVTFCAFDHAAFVGTEMSQYQPLVEDKWQKEGQKLVPNLMIILEVDTAHFHQRLTASGRVLNPFLRDSKFNYKFNQYLLNTGDRWGIKTERIDTSYLNPAQVLAQVLSIL